MTAAVWTSAEVLQWAGEQSLPATVLRLFQTQQITGAQLLAYLPLRLVPENLSLDTPTKAVLTAALNRLRPLQSKGSK